MLVSLKWLKDYVDLGDISAKEFCDKMIMTGSNLETCTELACGIEGVKLGQIKKIEKHPNADKLVICTVDLGAGKEATIVTGAPNVFEGAFVPVAVDGAKIPGPIHGQPKVEGGVTITKGELRGVLSEGMLCSAQELGYDDRVVPIASKDGIWILEGDFTDKLGCDFKEALDLADYEIDFEITPNRPDCLSMIGMAREAAATFGKTLKYPDTSSKAIHESAKDYIKVDVNSDFCKRYTARVVKDVKIEQSPWWMQKRLMAAGMRPINNMVDITNFVMLEYGQPLHAFDITSIEGAHIIVDTAKEGELFTTLDGEQRELDEQMLMIRDEKKPIGIAGVMGGLNSEITEETNTVVIESACFERANVRQTSKKLGLRTEASGRYEKGIDPNLCEDAADRVCHLIELLGCGKVLKGSVDIYKNPEKAPSVKARVSRINKVIGIDISREEMKGYLESLEMKVSGIGDELIVTPPTIRRDILEEVDIIEEVARMYGYDNVPLTFPMILTKAEESKSWKLRNIIRDVLCALGANEIQTFSFINDKILDDAGVPKDSWERNLIKIINPLGEDTAAMRTILTPGMLEVMGRNYARNIEDMRAYEIGITYMKDLFDEKALPDESFNLSIGLYGEGEDFFTLKGIVEELLNVLGIKNVSFVAESEYGIYHPGRCARILIDVEGENEPVELGIMGEVHPDVAENFGIGTRGYCCELMFNLLEEFASNEINYKPLPKFPATSRDVALIVGEEVLVGDIIKAVENAEHEILESVKLFDIYRGEQVDDGKKSIALSLKYRSKDKTLTDKEADEVHEKIVELLKEKFDAILREM